MDQFITIVIIFFFVYVFVYSQRNNFRFGLYVSVLVLAIFALLFIPSVRSFMSTTIWATFITTLEATGRGLNSLNDAIDKIRKGIENENKIRKDQQEELNKVQANIMDMQNDLESQQKTIFNINERMAAFLKEGKTFIFDQPDVNSKYKILTLKEREHIIFILLDQVPIWQTLQIQWFIYVQPKRSYVIRGNLLIFRWGDDLQKLNEKPLEVTYVPDPLAKPKFNSLDKVDNQIFLDGKKIDDMLRDAGIKD